MIMQLSNYTIVAAIEIYILLIIIGVVLFFRARKQRQLIRRQHEKLQHLVALLRKLKLPSAPLLTGGSTYKTYINAQLMATRNRYAGVSPDTDITTVSTSTGSLPQRALALRQKFLVAEEAAIIKGDGALKLDWEVFERTLTNSMNLVELDTSDDELVNLNKRVENLEKFKQLFFDMEKKWQDAQTQAREYFNQLAMMAEGVSDQDQFLDILDKYQKVYSEIDEAFDDGHNGIVNNPLLPIDQQVKININPLSTAEIYKLRTVAADQHRIINQLQRKLEQAITAEDKAVVITELQQQLQRQTRFVQESETCVKLLEEELSVATEKVNKQQQQLQASAEIARENERIKETLQKFTLESKSLMASIVDVEKENEVLKIKLQQLQAQVSTSSSPQSQDAAKNLQSDFLALKNQYVELETKYLDLKLKG